MKDRKPRTKDQNPFYVTEKCLYDDGTTWKECNKPWAYRCDGNPHNCKHLKWNF